MTSTENASLAGNSISVSTGTSSKTTKLLSPTQLLKKKQLTVSKETSLPATPTSVASWGKISPLVKIRRRMIVPRQLIRLSKSEDGAVAGRGHTASSISSTSSAFGAKSLPHFVSPSEHEDEEEDVAGERKDQDIFRKPLPTGRMKNARKRNVMAGCAISWSEDAGELHYKAPWCKGRLGVGDIVSIGGSTKLNYDVKIRFNLGEISLRDGEYDKASEHFTKSLEARSKHYGQNHQSVAEANEKLGDVESFRLHFDKADEHYVKALKIVRMEEESITDRSTDSTQDAVRILQKKAQINVQNNKKETAVTALREALHLLTSDTEESCDKNSSELIALQIKIGYLELDQGHDDDALEIFAEVAHSEIPTDVAVGHDIATIHYVSGLICERKHDLDGAMKCFSQAVLLKKKSLALEPLLLTLFRHMASVELKRENYDDALDYYQQAMSLMRRMEFKFSDAIIVCEKMVYIHRHFGRMEEVVGCYNNLLDITKKELGNSSEEVATVLHQLSTVYADMGETKLAVKMLKREGKVRANMNGGDPKQVVKLMIDIGAIYGDRRDHDLALKHFEEAVGILAQSGIVCEHGLDEKTQREKDEDDCTVVTAASEDLQLLDEKLTRCEDILQRQNFSGFFLSPQLFADAVNDMGNLYSEKSSYKAAISCYRCAIRIQLSGTVCDEEEFLKMNYNLGVALSRNGSHNEAVDVFDDVLQAQERLMDDNSVEIANTLNEMGNVYLAKGALKQATVSYKKALSIKKEILLVDDAEYLGTMVNLGVVFLQSGSYGKALNQFNYVLKVRRENLGENHVRVASVLSLIGHVHIKNGDYRRALDMYTECLRIRESTLGKCEPLVGRSLTDIAGVYLHLHDYPNAKKSCRDAVDVFVRAELPPDHQYIRDIKAKILQLDKALAQIQGKKEKKKPN